MKAIKAILSVWAIYAMFPTIYYKYLHKAGSAGSQKLILTFDDGPDGCYTPQLLDLLKRHHARAIFFVIADKAIRHPNIIRRMIEEGHEVGLHCFKHRKALYQLPHETVQDIERGSDFLDDLGVRVRYYRPPHGYVNLSMLHFLKKKKIKMMLWDILPRDWTGKKAECIFGAMISRLHQGNIICLHDSGEDTGGAPGAPDHMIQALERFIPRMQRIGFRFELPDETISLNDGSR
ncbi:MAG: polysaccharide deacetylase family protein [Peptostreptococcaceae bacterium]|nr:polysaccharide deacetylase family protein [Peptostreptococcaceae bacterium]